MLGSSYSPIIPLLQGGGSSSLLKYLLGEDYEFIDFVADKAARGGLGSCGISLGLYIILLMDEILHHLGALKYCNS